MCNKERVVKMKLEYSPKDDCYEFVIKSFFKVYTRYCYIPKINNITIKIDATNKDAPISFKETGTIILNTQSCLWCQVIYQLSHELCHLLVGVHIPHQHLWFEESICEVSSQFFLHKLTENWLNIGINLIDTNGELYAPLFKEYAISESKNFVAFDISKLLNNNSTIYKEIQLNGINRELNKNIANNLLPLFFENPKLWTAVHSLGKATFYSDFSLFLQSWLEVSPTDCSESISKIISLFNSNKDNSTEISV